MVTLLRQPKEATLSDSVFEDLQLRRLLTDKTVQVLRHALQGDGIRSRQELFRFIDTEVGMQRLRDCYALLKEYDRAERLWRSSSIGVEKLFLFRELLRQYITVARCLASFSGCPGTLGEVGESWQAQEPKIAELESAVGQLNRKLDAVSGFDISMAEAHYMTRPSAPETYLERLTAAGAKMGYPLGEHKPGRIRLNEALSHAAEELYPQEYAEIRVVCEQYEGINFREPLSYVEEFDFLFEIHALCEKATGKGIPVCYPTVAEQPCYLAKNVYDVSLFIKESPVIVPNDTYFSGDDTFYFLTGANGGGKTTYLRAVGINLLLFLGGCPIFADSAEIYPYDEVFSHFPADERFSEMSRLDEEEHRVDAMLRDAERVQHPFLVFNETYSGTDDKRGCDLTLSTAERIRNLGGSGLFVTHFHEVRGHGFPILNTVVNENATHIRTFRIVRDTGVHSSYAEDILKKYHLDRASLEERRTETVK